MKADKKPWQSLNRKERKQWVRRLQSQDPGLDVVHAQAAGIDVGNEAHYVAVRPDRDPEPVRRFECFTADLYRLADWLQSCGVKTVAMQSTGVYWIPLYEILEERGFEDAPCESLAIHSSWLPQNSPTPTRRPSSPLAAGLSP
jgi:hypothetical protein